MTLAEPIRFLPPIRDAVTLDKVVKAFKELVDNPADDIVQCLALLNGSLQYSRKGGYTPLHITHNLVVPIMSTLITKSGRKAYALTLINQLLLNRDKGEERLDCRDWTVYGDPTIAVYIVLGRR